MVEMRRYILLVKVSELIGLLKSVYKVVKLSYIYKWSRLGTAFEWLYWWTVRHGCRCMAQWQSQGVYWGSENPHFESMYVLYFRFLTVNSSVLVCFFIVVIIISLFIFVLFFIVLKVFLTAINWLLYSFERTLNICMSCHIVLHHRVILHELIALPSADLLCVEWDVKPYTHSLSWPKLHWKSHISISRSVNLFADSNAAKWQWAKTIIKNQLDTKGGDGSLHWRVPGIQGKIKIQHSKPTKLSVVICSYTTFKGLNCGWCNYGVWEWIPNNGDTPGKIASLLERSWRVFKFNTIMTGDCTINVKFRKSAGAMPLDFGHGLLRPSQTSPNPINPKAVAVCLSGQRKINEVRAKTRRKKSRKTASPSWRSIQRRRDFSPLVLIYSNRRGRWSQSICVSDRRRTNECASLVRAMRRQYRHRPNHAHESTAVMYYSGRQTDERPNWLLTSQRIHRLALPWLGK